ncbi:glycosyltransferase [Paenibacillus sp. MWE-103]|uniref:Glycosyltransferase n=1 Tax=Paenibacillus artemisiicola TaxID=1172618 RepID=A0ABS3WJS7_9BACL|nr:glycosyltransferase [Paenibacillus artemisiicola]
MAKVGIVMPAYYQNEAYIRIAIASVLNQTYRDFLLAIVVDGAPDLVPLFQELTQGDPRVSIAAYPQNQGVAYALNYGFEIVMDAGCEYLTWVSTDNYYYPYCLDVLVREMDRSHPNIGIVYSAFRHIREDGMAAHPPEVIEEVRRFQDRSKQALLEGCIIGPCFLQRTSYCRLVDGYRFTYIQDYDYWIRLTDYCDIKYIPIQLMDYRIDSPFSLSTHIVEQPAKHRVCWNEVHRSHYETRQRRGIKPDISVLFLLRPNEVEQATHAMQKVIDQYETNFELLVVSLATRHETEAVLAPYEDPRVRVLYYSYHADFNALRKALPKARGEWCVVFDSTRMTGNLGFLRAIRKAGALDKSKAASIALDGERIVATREVGGLYGAVTVKPALAQYLQSLG